MESTKAKNLRLDNETIETIASVLLPELKKAVHGHYKKQAEDLDRGETNSHASALYKNYLVKEIDKGRSSAMMAVEHGLRYSNVDPEMAEMEFHTWCSK